MKNYNIPQSEVVQISSGIFLLLALFYDYFHISFDLEYYHMAKIIQLLPHTNNIMVTTHQRNLVLVKVIFDCFFPMEYVYTKFQQNAHFWLFLVYFLYILLWIYTKNKLNCDLWSSFILIDNGFKYVPDCTQCKINMFFNMLLYSSLSSDFIYNNTKIY